LADLLLESTFYENYYVRYFFEYLRCYY